MRKKYSKAQLDDAVQEIAAPSEWYHFSMVVRTYRLSAAKRMVLGKAREIFGSSFSLDVAKAEIVSLSDEIGLESTVKFEITVRAVKK